MERGLSLDHSTIARWVDSTGQAIDFLLSLAETSWPA